MPSGFPEDQENVINGSTLEPGTNIILIPDDMAGTITISAPDVYNKTQVDDAIAAVIQNVDDPNGIVFNDEGLATNPNFTYDGSSLNVDVRLQMHGNDIYMNQQGDNGSSASIHNLADPTYPHGAANKNYVDNAILAIPPTQFNPTSIPISKVSAVDVYVPNAGTGGNDTLVDLASGSDAEGSVNGLIPYQHYDTAKAALISDGRMGLQLRVLNGIHDTSDIMYEGGIVYFNPGTGIHCTNMSDHLAIFNTGNTGSGGTDINSCKVLGHGTFTNDHGSGGGGFPGGIVEIDNDGANIQIEADSMIDNDGSGDFIDHDEGVLLIRVKNAISTGSGEIYLGGDGLVNARFESVTGATVDPPDNGIVEVVSLNGELNNEYQPIYQDLNMGSLLGDSLIPSKSLTFNVFGTNNLRTVILSQDDQTAYVVARLQSNNNTGVIKVNLQNSVISGPIDLGADYQIYSGVCTPDGGDLYLFDTGNPSVYVIDTSSMVLDHTVTLNGTMSSFSSFDISTDGATIIIANGTDNIDLVNTITYSATPFSVGASDGGTLGAIGVCFTSNDNDTFAVSYVNNTIVDKYTISGGFQTSSDAGAGGNFSMLRATTFGIVLAIDHSNNTIVTGLFDSPFATYINNPSWIEKVGDTGFLVVTTPNGAYLLGANSIDRQVPLHMPAKTFNAWSDSGSSIHPDLNGNLYSINGNTGENDLFSWNPINCAIEFNSIMENTAVPYWDGTKLTTNNSNLAIDPDNGYTNMYDILQMNGNDIYMNSRGNDGAAASIHNLQDPIYPHGAANKNYVDSNFLSLNGGTLAGNIDMSNTYTLNNVPFPVSDGDAVNKSYADGIAQGLFLKDSVRVATTSSLPTNTYDNMALTLTGNDDGVLSIDGVNVSTTNRVLIKNESDQTTNGIYVITSAGVNDPAGSPYVLTRASDFNDSSKIKDGNFVFVSSGSVNSGTQWALDTENPITLDSTPLNFTELAQPENVVPGDGLTKSGETLNVGAGTGIQVNNDDIQIAPDYVGQASITTVGTINSGIWNGTVEHLVTDGVTSTQITANAGLGTNGTASISGTDVSGTITLNTSILDLTLPGNSDLCTVSFYNSYDSAPRIIIMPANDAAWNLTLGLVRLRQSDTSSSVFKLRSGTAGLPATLTATYLFNYHVIQ